ncbi:MAG TPA: hypothetical protein VGR21_11785 [Cryptosporangiaceae bacterium]|nr:hypothetical protein [Cryptosporangiaceae bacterium]
MAAKKAAADAVTVPTGQNALTYYLHRRYSGPPDTTPACAATGNEQYMNRQNSTGDLEPCFESRVTSVVAGFRPLGIFASEDTLEAPLPAGSDVYATLYIASEAPAVVRPTGVLMATDREIGTGPGTLAPIVGSGPAGAACPTLGALCWTKYDLSFTTTRPAFTGEHLTFQVQMVGARSWAFGFEGTHTSKVAIVAAPLPPSGLDFGATVDSPAAGASVPETEKVVAGGRVTFPDLGTDPTGAGDHPTERAVEVSLDDPSFDAPRQATLDTKSGTWRLDLGELGRGAHTVYVRARIDRTYSKVASSAFRVLPQARVEWQVVPRNATPDPAGWRRADGLESWRFRFDTADEAKGRATLVVRLVDKETEVARTTVRIRIA